MAATNQTTRQTSLSAFSRLLKRLRTSADLTQEELAERASVSARLISDLERGVIRRPRRDTVQMLADGLELTGVDRDTFVAIARRRQSRVEDAAPVVRLSNLPIPPTGLIGREREITAATFLLLEPEVRLLTLTGPGGVGKTRLALEVATRTSERFADSVAFVDLSPVTEPGLVLPAIARALGVRDQGGAAPADQLIDALRESQVLVVLDNLEHLLPAGAELARLLERCPALTILATSRQALRLRAEREYPVNPLALPNLQEMPSLDELGRIPAIDLFVRRAEAVRPAFALTDENARVVAEVAVRLDGLPLAIELAAARIRVLSPAELLERLDRRLPLLTGGAQDLPSRHQALRAAIDWSHDLLDPGERRLFRRLAVFSGGFTLEAAEQVCADAESPDAPLEVLDGLASLVDKSLLRALEPLDGGAQQTQTRYGMLETIREFGLERLVASGEEHRVRARHAAWGVEFAERAEPELTGADQVRWFARLEIEHDNLRAALGWAIEDDRADIAQRFCKALWRFWTSVGLFAEGRRWTEAALRCGSSTPTHARAHALNAAGILAQQLGAYDAAEGYLLEALRVFRVLDDRTGIAYSYGNLGVIADVQEDYEKAVDRYENALAIFQELGDSMHAGFMFGNLGLIAYFQGDYDRSNKLSGRALAIAQERGDLNSTAISLGNLSQVAIARGEHKRAEALLREVLLLRKTVSNRTHLAGSFDRCAVIAATRQLPARAARLFGAAAGLRAELGTSLPPNDREFNERYILAAQKQLGNDAFTSAWEEGAAMSIDEAIAYALDDDAMAHARNSAATHDG